MPGRKQLAQDYGVAATTVERAVAELIADGTLRADSRRGTFVAGLVSEHPAAATPQTSGAAGSKGQCPRKETLIGVMTPWKVDAVDAEPEIAYSDNSALGVLRAIERVVGMRGCATRFAAMFPERPGELSYEEALAPLSNAGAVAIVDLHDEMVRDRSFRSALERAGLIVVLVTGGAGCIGWPSVCEDNVAAGYGATAHLLRRGYRKIAFLASYEALWVNERLQGAREACRMGGLGSRDLRVWPSASRRVSQRQPVDPAALDTALDEIAGNPGSVGVVAACDEIALMTIERARQAGLAAGRDYGIVGFDDRASARSVGLTSMRYPADDIGAQATQMAFDALDGQRSASQIRVESHLIVRESSGHAGDESGNE